MSCTEVSWCIGFFRRRVKKALSPQTGMAQIVLERGWDMRRIGYCAAFLIRLITNLP